MIVESVVILILMALTALVFARARRRGWALRVLPLLVAPLANLLFWPAARRLFAEGADLRPARAAVYLAALAATAAWVLLCARGIRPRAARAGYALSTIAFTAIVLIVFYIRLR